MLLRRSLRRARRRHAFTLMEVLLVLAILVVLGSMSVLLFGNVKAGADIKAAKAQIVSLDTPIQLFVERYNRYPATLDELQNPPALNNGQPSLILDKPIPADPWGNPYQYAYPGQHNGQTYDLWSNGAGGVGGDATIGNW